MTARTLTILGSTGSVGSNTIDLVERHRDAFAVEALTAHRNAALLAQQAKRVGARRAVIGDAAHFRELKSLLSGSGIEPAAGPQAVIEAAAVPSDVVIAAIVGAAGIEPTMAAIERGATVGLANKECLVCAGALIMAEVEESGATLLPVDSEHSAIHQVFDFEQPEAVRAIVLTASGGPFRCATADEMAGVTPAQAIAHPNWSMGRKISVDSATMMNKGLEIIEAFHLFPIRIEQIEVVVHPQSIIHGMVEYIDGSFLAQLGNPDMRTPIAYALGWPARLAAPVERLRFWDLKQLTFEQPDEIRFPALRLAKQTLAAGGAAPLILNAANEIAVARFLDGEIGFLDIVAIVEETLATLPNAPLGSIADVIAADAEARRLAEQSIHQYAAGVSRYA